VSGKIFGSNRDKVTGGFIRLHKEELVDLYCSPNITRVIKSRRMRCAGHVARMGERKGYKVFWWGNLRKGEHLEDPGVYGRIILRWIFTKWDVRTWIG
jgi:hypothetical protein